MPHAGASSGAVIRRARQLAAGAAALVALLLIAASATAAEIAPLLDPDARVRSAHRRDLLQSVGVDDLSELRDAVREAFPDRPAPPALRLAVRSVVTAAYLREAALRLQNEPDAAANRVADGLGNGFLGVSNSPEIDLRTAEAGIDQGGGVVIWATVPGFVASLTLEEGDVLVGVADVSDAGRVDDAVRLHTFGDLVSAIGQLDAGQRVRLFVQRGGRFVSIDLALDRRIFGPPLASQAWLFDEGVAALDAAAARWSEEFAPLFVAEAESDRATP